MDLPPPVFLSTVVARTAIVLLVVVIGIRFFGKRQVGELNLFDIALVLLLGKAALGHMLTRYSLQLEHPALEPRAPLPPMLDFFQARFGVRPA